MLLSLFLVKGRERMKKCKHIIFSTLIIYILGITFYPQVTHANDETGNFNYRIVRPENQSGYANYFDLKMTPSQKQTVQIELQNISDKSIDIEILLNSAKTNANGVLEFGSSKLEKDASLKYDFKDIVKGPEKVTIPPNETAPLNLDIDMPAESYDGIITGGIQMQVIPSEETKKREEKEQQIVNRYAFVVGMVLRETETPVQPDVKFNKFYAGLTNYRNAVYVNFSNVEAEFLENMSIDLQVTKKGSDEVLYDTTKTEMRMAPNSKIDFPVEMNGERMEAGDYTGHILVKSKDKKWEWTDDFTITQKEADKYNGQDVTLVQERGIDWKIIALIVGGIFIVSTIVFVVIRVMKKKQKVKKKKKKKKK